MALSMRVPLANAPTSSPGVLGGASLRKLSVAMSVAPAHCRPSSLPLRAAVSAGQEKEEGFGGLWKRGGIQLGRWSTATQKNSLGRQEGRERRQRGSSVYANYYGREESGTPLSPYVAPPQVTKSPHQKNSLGQAEVPKFWDYGAPQSLRPYTGPNSYGAPKSYGIPAYSALSAAARVAAVEAEPMQGIVIEEEISTEPKEIEPALDGGDNGLGKDGGGGGGGGGDGSGDGEDSEPQKPISTAQKLTLVYAALVGVGGLIGFVKSGSNKSLISGGGAALALFLVFTQLPSHPTFASSFGLGISAVLLGVMYPRFKKSGKFMPSGLVALVSLIMTGGYIHGIVRTAH